MSNIKNNETSSRIFIFIEIKLNLTVVDLVNYLKNKYKITKPQASSFRLWNFCLTSSIKPTRISKKYTNSWIIYKDKVRPYSLLRLCCLKGSTQKWWRKSKKEKKSKSCNLLLFSLLTCNGSKCGMIREWSRCRKMDLCWKDFFAISFSKI